MKRQKKTEVVFSLSVDNPISHYINWYSQRDMDFSLIIYEVLHLFYRYHNAIVIDIPYESMECLFDKNIITQYDLYVDFSHKTNFVDKYDETIKIFTKEDYVEHVEMVYLNLESSFRHMATIISISHFIDIEVVKYSSNTLILRLKK